MTAMTMALFKLFMGDLKVSLAGLRSLCCAPNWESAQLNLRFICVRPRLTIAGHFAACRNVSRENPFDAGNHRPRPCLTRFAVVMNPVATSFPQDITSEST
jgi:hypothetical protein